MAARDVRAIEQAVVLRGGASRERAAYRWLLRDVAVEASADADRRGCMIKQAQGASVAQSPMKSDVWRDERSEGAAKRVLPTEGTGRIAALVIASNLGKA